MHVSYPLNSASGHGQRASLGSHKRKALLLRAGVRYGPDKKDSSAQEPSLETPHNTM